MAVGGMLYHLPIHLCLSHFPHCREQPPSYLTLYREGVGRGGDVGLAAGWVPEDKALLELRAVNSRKSWQARASGEPRLWWGWGFPRCREQEAELELDPWVRTSVCSFIHSLIHSLIHSYTPSLPHSFIHCLVHLFSKSLLSTHHVPAELGAGAAGTGADEVLKSPGGRRLVQRGTEAEVGSSRGGSPVSSWECFVSGVQSSVFL